MKKMNLGLLLLPVALAAFPLSANAQESTQESTPSMPETSTAYTYECDGGQTFQAEYGTAAATVQLDNQTLTLAQIPSGSGTRYSDGTTTLLTKGEKATVEVNGATTYSNCVAQSTTDNTTTGSTTTTPDGTTAEGTTTEGTTTGETAIEGSTDRSTTTSEQSPTDSTTLGGATSSEGSSTSSGGLTSSEGSSTSGSSTSETTVQRTQTTTRQTTVEPAPAQTTTSPSEPVRALW